MAPRKTRKPRFWRPRKTRKPRSRFFGTYRMSNSHIGTTHQRQPALPHTSHPGRCRADAPRWHSSRTRRVTGPLARNVTRRVGESIPAPSSVPSEDALCLSRQPASQHPISTVSFPAARGPRPSRDMVAVQRPRAPSPRARQANGCPTRVFCILGAPLDIAQSFRDIRKPPGYSWQASSPDSNPHGGSEISQSGSRQRIRSLHGGTRFAPGYVRSGSFQSNFWRRLLVAPKAYHRQPARKRAVSGVHRLSQALQDPFVHIGRLRRPRGLQAQARRLRRPRGLQAQARRLRRPRGLQAQARRLRRPRGLQAQARVLSTLSCQTCLYRLESTKVGFSMAEYYSLIVFSIGRV